MAQHSSQKHKEVRTPFTVTKSDGEIIGQEKKVTEGLFLGLLLREC